MGSKMENLIKNTVIIGIGSMFVQAIGFLLIPVFTAFLSVGDYGTIDLIQSYAGLVGPLITLQLGMTVFQFLVDVRGNKKDTTEVISTALAALTVLLAIFISLGVLATQFVHITHEAIAMCVIILGALFAVFGQIARGLGHNTIFAIGGIVAGLVSALISVILVVQFHMGASGVLIGISMSALIACIYYAIALRLDRFIRHANINKELMSKMLRYALPLLPAALSWWIISASDRTIITFFLGAEANGLYALASKFAFLFATLYSFFNMSWVESVAMHINSKGRDEFFSSVSNATVKFFGSMAAGVVAVVPLIFDLVIGEDFHAAYPYIPILVFAAFCNTLVGNYSAIYFAKKMTRATATTAMTAAFINIVASLALIHFIGLYATALATVVGYGAMAVYRHYDTKKYVNIAYEPYVFLRVFILIGFATSCYYLNNLWLNIASLVIVAGLSLWLNKSVVALFKTKIISAKMRLTKKSDDATASVQI